MSDLLKGLTGGGWAGLFAWIFPCAISFAAFSSLVYSAWPDAPLHDKLGELSITEGGGLLLVVAAMAGFILNAVSTPLYRLLEGYAWPMHLRRWGVRRQTLIKHRLEREVKHSKPGWEQGLQLERLARLPLNDEDVAPTRLGNALRSFELYGSSRFGLDSQTMWAELCSVVPKYLQQELERSRAIVDFFVALVYLSGLLGAISIGIAARNGWPLVAIVYGSVSLLSTFIWYRMAVASSTYWSSTVQALVNVGRSKLAAQMGLELPLTIEAERQMWSNLIGFVFYGDPGSAARLDPFRKAGNNSAHSEKDEEDGGDDDEE